jgi:hypothetical protein
LSEGLGPLREAVNEVMHHQFTHSRPAMHALQVLIDEADDAADEIDRLRARVLDLEAQCEAGAASEQRWLDWLVAQGLLHYYPFCKRPDGSNGPAWVLRRAYMTDGDSCEAWHADSAAGALQAFLRA